MSKWLIIATGLAYAYVAVEQFLKGNNPISIMFIGYAFSNIGIYLTAK